MLSGRQSLLRSAAPLWRCATSSGGIRRRCYAEEAKKDTPTNKAVEAFKEMWSKVAPNLDFPKTPHESMASRPPVPPAIPEKLTVNFVLPSEVAMNAEKVDMVILPATSGLMGVLPGHVPTIAELKPGVLSVHDGGQVKTQYFLSSGFAFVHANSVTDIVVVEAAPLDRFDPDEVRKNLADYNQKLSSATTDLDKAQAQIGVDVFGSLAFALGVTA
ncbi:hypothetical protein SELMODRAFT_166842 [Selaginella moellendorffii]|uniref:ATP synthase F1 complex delta/epsilon subunit N-terminal domain-containing protein n=1 Tax=Selaginella moellendorffii TaxID=88036 RepID=D8R026_SELML|nr:ATP synthase subunit delta', mitochondrial [Selaginella moellendorffii]XP_002988832.1 ATP synthase subunit delta', mitochondrial [Selaginella moellendorffii]EFJ10094.1 hypothetical protein SELMODRAFT_184168 [Selaginella moellendorffii]EFJ34898.1 hypothetical protein SELMODRAFT_166842 [Selaginella moellendorffii]|eukprot:XP_002964565.1 ATP synthase subunit delta', mitochondrial [Selaginella moellendorffii]